MPLLPAVPPIFCHALQLVKLPVTCVSSCLLVFSSLTSLLSLDRSACVAESGEKTAIAFCDHAPLPEAVHLQPAGAGGYLRQVKNTLRISTHKDLYVGILVLWVP